VIVAVNIAVEDAGVVTVVVAVVVSSSSRKRRRRSKKEMMKKKLNYGEDRKEKQDEGRKQTGNDYKSYANEKKMK